MSMHLEIIYIDKNDHGRHIGKGAEGEFDQWAIDEFERAKQYEESKDTAPFFLDLKEDNGDIVETIGLSAEGYEALLGEKPLSDKEYVELDATFWQNVKIIASAV